MRLLFASALLSSAATAFFYWWYAPILPVLGLITVTNGVLSSIVHHSHVYPYRVWHKVDIACVLAAIVVELWYSSRWTYTVLAGFTYVFSKNFIHQYLPGRVNIQQALHATAHVIATLGHVLWFKDLSTNK